MKKSKSRNRKVKILQDKSCHKQGRTRINTFTDSYGGTEHYKSKSLDRNKSRESEKIS